MSLPTKSEIDKYQVNTTNNTITNNQSDLITLNIYNDQKNINEETKVNINDTQMNPINNINNNGITKRSAMQPQNNYLYLDNMRPNNYPLSDNFRNQVYPNYNLNAYNQYGYNRQYNPMINMNNNSPNGNPVNIVDPNNPTNTGGQQIKKKGFWRKSAIFPITGIIVIVVLIIVVIATTT